MAWNTTVFKHGKRAEENIEGAKVGYYDLTKDAVVFPMPYVNDCFAIAAASKILIAPVWFLICLRMTGSYIF